MMKKIILSILTIVFLLPQISSADETELNDIFTPMIENMMAENNIQGFSFSVVSKDGPLFKNTYGVKKPRTGRAAPWPPTSGRHQ